jgi:hypothetical protein
MKTLPIALCSVLAAGNIHAVELRQVAFSHVDWEIVCDNTGTCRAAGYQPEDQDDQHHHKGVTVLLTRAAGPDAPVQADVQVAPADDAPARVVMQIGSREHGEVKLKEAGGNSTPPRRLPFWQRSSSVRMCAELPGKATTSCRPRVRPPCC